MRPQSEPGSWVGLLRSHSPPELFDPLRPFGPDPGQAQPELPQRLQPVRQAVGARGASKPRSGQFLPVHLHQTLPVVADPTVGPIFRFELPHLPLQRLRRSFRLRVLDFHLDAPGRAMHGGCAQVGRHVVEDGPSRGRNRDPTLDPGAVGLEAHAFELYGSIGRRNRFRGGCRAGHGSPPGTKMVRCPRGTVSR
jgi:hypothetical protein